MKRFEEPMIKVVAFATEDIITTSGVTEDIDNAKIAVYKIFGTGDFTEDNLFI